MTCFALHDIRSVLSVKRIFAGSAVDEIIASASTENVVPVMRQLDIEQIGHLSLVFRTEIRWHQICRSTIP